MHLSRFLVVIPALNPPPELLILLQKLRQNGLRCLVIDDGSSAAAEDIFQQVKKLDNCILLRHERNLGKGRALKSAFAYVLKNFPQALGVVTADCDGQHCAEDIITCSEHLQTHPEALILGCRSFDCKSVPMRNYLGNCLSRYLFRKYLHCPVSDTQSGLRGIPLSFMAILLDKPGDGFEFETLMLWECCNPANGKIYPICEVPIKTVYKNSRTHFKAVSDSLKILKVILKNYFAAKSIFK